jgi:hypothetical protein
MAWYAFLLFGIPLLFYIGAAWKGLPADEMIPVSSLGGYLVALLLFAIKGPVEEIGWRGFALPVLQRRMSPFWSGLVLGILWGVWHLPAFFLSGTPQSAWSFTDFFIGTVALSLIATALFNASRGSILLPALFHLQVINPLWPDAQPYDTLPFVAAAIIVVWLNRASMLRRGGGMTEIIPDPDGPNADVPNADVPQPDTPQPDTPQPDTSQPDTPQPDASQPDVSQPGIPNLDLPEPSAERPRGKTVSPR